jgi:CheY-like chemotaxis protein
MATVLIVDDDAYIRQLLCELAEELGHTVLSASDGTSALELAQTHRPQLILSDVMMPGLDGYGLVHALHTDPALAHTTVFLMSAAFTGERKAQDGQVTGFIAKPFDLLQIEQLLRSLAVRGDA